MDADGDGFGVQGDAEFVCPNERQDNYIETVLRDGVEVFDCNDADITINPDELDVCDDVDNDCNGDIDELDGLESKRWYKDNDGDGYGYFDTEDEDSVVYSCTGYPGLVQNILDCDDTNIDINPSAIEQCDDVGNSCNGQIDEPTAEGVVKWYRDADLDGYGSDVIFVESCEPPEGYIARQDGQAFDCNDNDQAIYPGAVEVCDDVDNNCNVLIDEGADSTAPADASTFYADFDGDGYVECEGFDSNNWFGGGDCNDSSVITYPGAANLTDSNACLSDADGDGYADRLWSICPVSKSLDDARYTFLGESPYSDTGFSATIAGDVDGDGLDEIFISSKDNGTNATVESYIVLGSSLGSSSTIDLVNADYSFVTDDDGSNSMMTISSMGDVDADGNVEVMTSMPYNDANGIDAGMISILSACEN